MSSSVNPLRRIIENGLDHTISKWHHYLPLYDRYFSKYRDSCSPNNKLIIIEFGVCKGGSLDMWNAYFGKENCLIFGIDIDPKCLEFERGNIKIFIADQENVNHLVELRKRIPPADIIIDDGGHYMQQQINTFNIMFNHVKPGGIFLCEDTHTSYWPGYGGSIDRTSNSFMELSKITIDMLNGYHYNQVTPFTQTCSGIHFHDSMVFFEKSEKIIQAPTAQTWNPKNANTLSTITTVSSTGAVSSTTVPSTETNKNSLIVSTINSNLYLELMKKTLSDAIYSITDDMSEEKKKHITDGYIWPDRAHTMIGLKRLDNIQYCVEKILQENIEGDLIETGVWKGGATIFMKAILKTYGDTKRRVFVADSFEGLPPPDERYPADRGDTHHTIDVLRVSKEDVEKNFKKYDLLDDNVVFIKGFFEQSLPAAPIDKLSILRLDGDMYSSTIQVLEILYDKLSIGGYLIIDDYALPGCRKAITDFREKRGITEDMYQVDYSGVFWKKQK